MDTSNIKYHVAVVDDDADNLANAKSLLVENGIRVTCLVSGRDLLRLMKKKRVDLILLDVMMPGMDGFETLQALRSFEKENGCGMTPVIFLTGDNDSSTENRGLTAGASDFIRKPFNRDILIRRIRNTMAYNRTIETLTQEATMDRLTGFLNKAGGTERVLTMCAEKTGVMMILDLDNFKLVNDLFGHDMGDKVLMAFADIVRDSISKGDVACRIGGDEFMVFLDGEKDRGAVQSLTEHLNEAIVRKAKALMGENFDIPLGISVGAVMVPDMGRDYAALFSYADSSLYSVKKNGKHGCGIYDPSLVTEERDDDIEKVFSRLTRIFEERNILEGGQILGKDAFTGTYRHVMRDLLVTGREAVRILFSLTCDGGEGQLTQKALAFGRILQKRLRKNDMILHSGTGQFFVLITDISESEAHDIIADIIRFSGSGTECDGVDISFVMDGVAAGPKQNRKC